MYCQLMLLLRTQASHASPHRDLLVSRWLVEPVSHACNCGLAWMTRVSSGYDQGPKITSTASRTRQSRHEPVFTFNIFIACLVPILQISTTFVHSTSLPHATLTKGLCYPAYYSPFLYSTYRIKYGQLNNGR
jgi:hypothetical protein